MHSIIHVYVQVERSEFTLYQLFFINPSHSYCAEAGAVIHTHSKAAVLATLLFPGTEFRITHQEMIKGVGKGCGKGNHRYDDVLVVPIIENTAEERDLKVDEFLIAGYSSVCVVTCMKWNHVTEVG